jgi:hypothetical protein
MLSLHCKYEVVLRHVEEQHLVCFQVAGQDVAVDYTQNFYALVAFLKWV